MSFCWILFDSFPLLRPSDPSAAEQMETEVAADEAAGAGDATGAEAAKADTAATGEESGDRTDGPEAAGAPGATPTADPSAEAAVPSSKDP